MAVEHGISGISYTLLGLNTHVTDGREPISPC